MTNIKRIVLGLINNNKIFAILASKTTNYIVGTFRNESVMSFISRKGLQYKIEDSTTKRSLYIPKIIDGDMQIGSRLVDCDSPIVFSTSLKNVYAFRGCETMLVGHRAVNERFSYAFSKHVFHNSPGGGYQNNTQKQSHFFFKKPNLVIDKAINLLGEASSNYYHFMIDICSKMVYINNHPELSDVPLLVDSVIQNKNTFIALLNGVNKHHHKIIYVNSSVFIKDLYYFSPASWSLVMPNVLFWNKTIKELKSHPYRLVKNEKVINMYRDEFLPTDKLDGVGNKIFIRRKNLSRMINEDQVIKLLDKYGYQPISLEDYSLLDQIKIFNNSKIIVSEEGAGCVNMVYCQKRTKYILITPKNWVSYTYSSLAYLLNVDITYILSSECDYHDRKHIVNIDCLEHVIKKL